MNACARCTPEGLQGASTVCEQWRSEGFGASSNFGGPYCVLERSYWTASTATALCQAGAVSGHEPSTASGEGSKDHASLAITHD
jgi:hypothetical protein